MNDNYSEHVEHLEAGLAPYAKRSFESFSQCFVNGNEVFEYYQKLWCGQERPRLLNRTPIQRERDKIIYSDSMRKLTEKYHILYYGQERIVRNYTTHTMRMSQVARSICRGLELNSDFAEAIALGSKLGATPFIHAAKSVISSFVVDTIFNMDNKCTKEKKITSSGQMGFDFQTELKEIALPSWIQTISDEVIRSDVTRYIPWCAGSPSDPAYSSGRESYWLLSTNPFTRTSRSATYSPETMYGIWRHTRGLGVGENSFWHKIRMNDVVHCIEGKHVTYEAIVVQYSDDITWAIENLNDANKAVLLYGISGGKIGRDLFKELAIEISNKIKSSTLEPLLSALHRQDTGSVYTYFISDFVENSKCVIGKLDDGGLGRRQLISGDNAALIGLSDEGRSALTEIVNFLDSRVFSEARVKNRKEMLSTISRACLDLLYNGDNTFIKKRIEQKKSIESWTNEMEERAILMLDNKVHRLQLSVDIFSDMSDQEIFDFVGIQSL